MIKLNAGVQPYIIACENNRSSIRDYKVIIDTSSPDTNCGTVIEGFDYLFKVYFVFKTEYIRGLENFYRFLKHYFYKVPLDGNLITTKMKKIYNRIFVSQDGESDTETKYQDSTPVSAYPNCETTMLNYFECQSEYPNVSTLIRHIRLWHHPVEHGRF